ncbi:hypothetical protein OAK75_12795 [Bacteriovoracales bacterium]|nr:hypothetical protein [Bacteriovoracales bacterium]
MFVNQSIVPNVSSIFTQEVHLLLSRYSGLEVYSGYRRDTDAVLLGIVSSGQRVVEVFQQGDKSLVSKDLLSGRSSFYVNSSTSYKMNLRIVLLKRPDPRLIKLVQGPLGDHIKGSPQIVLDESFSLGSSFARGIGDNSSEGVEGRSVNFTKSKGWFRIMLKELAKVASERIRKEVLNAF